MRNQSLRAASKSRIVWISVLVVIAIGMVLALTITLAKHKSFGAPRILNSRESLFRELERESARLHTEFIEIIHAAEAWQHDNDLKHLKDSFRAVRVYQDGEMKREWAQPEVAGLAFDLEEVLSQSAEIQLMQLDQRFLGLGWTSPDGQGFFVVLDRSRFPHLESHDPRVSFALVNAANQILAMSEGDSPFAVLRPGLSYANSATEVAQTRDFLSESLAWKSLPEMPDLFLVARIQTDESKTADE